jgi:hypothetical protein
VIVNLAIVTAREVATETDVYSVWLAIQAIGLFVLPLILSVARNVHALQGRAGLRHPPSAIGSPASIGSRWHAQLLDLPGVLALSVPVVSYDPAPCWAGVRPHVGALVELGEVLEEGPVTTPAGLVQPVKSRKPSMRERPTCSPQMAQVFVI